MGGGAFIAVYIIALFVIAVPVLVAEVTLGRLGKSGPITGMKNLVKKIEIKKNPFLWVFFAGVLPITGAVLMIGLYSVIGGWTLRYMWIGLSGKISVLDGTSDFGSFVQNPIEMGIWYAIFLAVSVFVVANGVQKGIGRMNMIVMPLGVLMMVGFCIYAATTDGFSDAVSFIFDIRLSSLSVSNVFSAIGHSFFSLSVGLGTMFTYGAYLKENSNIGRLSVIIAIGDTLIAILSGFIIFPFLFTYNIDLAEGPGLVFVTMIQVFERLQFGSFLCFLFFLFMFFLALTSSVSIIEPFVSWIEDRFPRIKRKIGVVAIGLFSSIFGVLCILSFNTLSHFSPLGFLGLEGKTFFDIIDFFISGFVMPITGFATTIFLVYLVKKSLIIEALDLSTEKSTPFVFDIWFFCARYIAPIGIIVIFIMKILQ